KLYADGRGPCYTYTDDGNLATRTWARGVTTSYTYDAWGRLTSTTSSDGTPVATRPLYWQPRTSQGNFSLFYTHDGNKNVSEAVFYQRARGVAAHDEYAPFGEVTAQTRGNAWGTLDLAADNPWRFSSEYAESTRGQSPFGLAFQSHRQAFDAHDQAAVALHWSDTTRPDCHGRRGNSRG
ncbi:MAG: RHS repeat domain-containing protein, partial [Kiritimatiellia bacterium]